MKTQIISLMRGTLFSVCILAGVTVLIGCASDDSDTDATQTVSRIAIIMDESASFKGNLPAAATIVQRFIRENATSGSAEIYLITADRSPKAYYFPAAELLNKRGADVLAKITLTNPLDGTDIVGALQLAHQKLVKNNGTKVGKQYLLCFSDMYADRQTNPKIEFKPLEAFDWKSLQGMQPQFYFVGRENERILNGLLEKAGVPGLVLDAIESTSKKVTEQSDSADE